MKADEKIQMLKMRFILHPDPRYSFFASLLYRLNIFPDTKRTQSMAVDGRNLIYSPDFVDATGNEELLGVLAHEVLHCALAHHARMAGRDPQRFNIACDLAINPLLIDSGFKLPQAALMPGVGEYPRELLGKSAEEIYELLTSQSQVDRGPSNTPAAGTDSDDRPGAGDFDSDDDADEEELEGDESQQQEEGDEEGDEPGDGNQGLAGGSGEEEEEAGGTTPAKGFSENIGGCGCFHEPEKSSPADLQEDIESWAVAAKQARDVCEGKNGTLAGSLKTLVEGLAKPVYSGWDILRRYLCNTSRSDFNWSRPSRKHVGTDLYLPHLRSDSLDRTYVWIDCSGSITDETLEYYASNLQAIFEMYSGSVVIGYHDTKVHFTQTWSREDGKLKMTAYGRGGTDHNCTFDFMEKQPERPALAIFFTDMESYFPKSEPDYPVIWACSSKHLPYYLELPSWGEVIYVPNKA